MSSFVWVRVEQVVAWRLQAAYLTYNKRHRHTPKIHLKCYFFFQTDLPLLLELCIAGNNAEWWSDFRISKISIQISGHCFGMQLIYGSKESISEPQFGSQPNWIHSKCGLFAPRPCFMHETYLNIDLFRIRVKCVFVFNSINFSYIQ